MKKALALALALILALSLCTTAFADGGKPVISVSGDDSHTYSVYQIFTGKINKEGILTDVKWGVNSTGTAGEGVDDEILEKLSKTTGSDRAKLDVILQYLNGKTDASGTVSKGSPLSVEPGYYLIKDANSLNGQDDAFTTYVVKVAGENVTINRKTAKPDVDKFVYDDEEPAGFYRTADHNINESFQFRLVATLPEDGNLAAYESYKLIFHDTPSAGITFEKIDSVKVTKNGNSETVKYDCTANPGDAGKPFTLTIDDLTLYTTQLSGAAVEVIYSAHLNEKAEIYNPGNPNTVCLEYSNNPNYTGTGTGGGEVHPGPFPEEETTGKTPDHTVTVFTYDMPNFKCDGEGEDAKGLGDAHFRLYSDADCTNEIKLAGDGNVYYPIADQQSGKGVEMVSPDGGRFVIRGLDYGTYYLSETKAPEGYNECGVITVRVMNDHDRDINSLLDENNNGPKLEIGGEACTENRIVNKRGIVLPETGGIGTTVFYVIGGILVLTAAVLLITKKRMAKDE